MKSLKDHPHLQQCNPMTCVSGNMMKVNRIVANVFRKHLRPFGITDSQLSTMFIITKAEEVNQHKLSQFLFMEKSTVNRNISRLIANGYIKKDARMFLHTTRKGKDFLERIIPSWNKAMMEINSILGEDGTQAVDLLTKKLTA